MRIAFFDNIKVILIYFVVLGHLLSGFFGENDIVDSIYLLIFLFHMPLFIFVSGYFSKGFQRKNYLKKLATKLLIPYLIFQIIYTTYYNLYGSDLSYNPFIPRWALWFLISLFCWNVLLHLFTKVRYSVVLAFVLGIVIGYVEVIDGVLSLSRTFFFFPFFLLGYYAKEEHIMYFKKKYSWLMGFLLLIIGLCLVYKFMPNEFKSWMIGKRSYIAIANGELGLAWLNRLTAYILMIITSVITLTLIPKRNVFFSNVGKYTMYIFLLHLFFVQLVIKSPLHDYIISHSNYYLLILISFVICYISQHKYMRWATKGIVEFNFTIKKKASSERPVKSGKVVRSSEDIVGSYH